jgi:hypothetical protein
MLVRTRKRPARLQTGQGGASLDHLVGAAEQRQRDSEAEPDHQPEDRQGHRVADGQCGELFAAAVEQCIGANHERACPQLNQRGESHIDAAEHLDELAAPAAEIANHWSDTLLRARRERPRRCEAKDHELNHSTVHRSKKRSLKSESGHSRPIDTVTAAAACPLYPQ